MKKVLLFILLQLVLQATLFAQTTDEERLLLETVGPEKFAEIANQELIRSKVQINQAGNSNNASVTQATVGSKPNGAFITQVGLLNRATLVQQGQGNHVIAAQRGNGNAYEGYITGDNNTSSIIQNGSGNSINQLVDGNNLDYTLIQMGNNNSITQIENSLDSRSYKVVQQGNNMNITIERSNIGVPVSATKK